MIDWLIENKESKSLNKCIDYIFDNGEGLLLDGKYEEFDLLLKDDRIKLLDVNLQIGFLTISNTRKRFLNNRHLVYENVYNELLNKYTKNDIDLIIGKLK